MLPHCYNKAPLRKVHDGKPIGQESPPAEAAAAAAAASRSGERKPGMKRKAFLMKRLEL